MKKAMLIVMLLIMGGIVMQTTVVSAAAPASSMQQVGASSNNTTYNPVKQFFGKLWWLVIIAPSAFVMAVPWIIWAFNYIKSKNEEDPNAEAKAKQMMHTAIIVDIVVGSIMSGLLIGVFYWLVSS